FGPLSLSWMRGVMAPGSLYTSPFRRRTFHKPSSVKATSEYIGVPADWKGSAAMTVPAGGGLPSDEGSPRMSLPSRRMAYGLPSGPTVPARHSVLSTSPSPSPSPPGPASQTNAAVIVVSRKTLPLVVME